MRMAERQRQFSRVLGRFLVYDDRVDVLAITGSKQRIDHSMSPDEARALWADLCQCGWHRASEDEITQHQMSHRTAVNLDSLEPRCIGSVPNVLSAASDGFAVHRDCGHNADSAAFARAQYGLSY
jgi:hypothetical protein